MKGIKRVGRDRRMDYELMVELYSYDYSTVLIGDLLGTPNGHVSKVLRKMGVQMRPKGMVVQPIPFEYWEEGVQLMLIRDADMFKRYKVLMGREKVDLGDYTVGELLEEGYLEDIYEEDKEDDLVEV